MKEQIVTFKSSKNSYINDLLLQNEIHDKDLQIKDLTNQIDIFRKN